MNRITSFLCIVCILFVANVSAKDYEAELLWPDKQVMAFPVTGVIDNIEVQVGQQVKQGQLLAQLDLIPFQVQLQKAQAKLDRIDPLLFDAQREFDQAQELFERTVLSEVELQKTESVLKGLQADHDEATAELRLANWNYAHAKLKAPFAGRVTIVSMHKGGIVSEDVMANVMIVMVPSNLMQATFSVEADIAGQYVTGQNGHVEVASERYPAIVKSISMNNKQYQIRLGFSVPADHSYVEGQKAKVMF